MDSVLFDRFIHSIFNAYSRNFSPLSPNCSSKSPKMNSVIVIRSLFSIMVYFPFIHAQYPTPTPFPPTSVYGSPPAPKPTSNEILQSSKPTNRPRESPRTNEPAPVLRAGTTTKKPEEKSPEITRHTKTTVFPTISSSMKRETIMPKLTTRRITEKRMITRRITTIKAVTKLPTTTVSSGPIIPNECASDIVFVLDATGSVRDDYQRQKDFVRQIVSNMNVGPADQQVGLVLYSSKLRQTIAIELGQYQNTSAVLIAIDNLPYYGGITATGAAIDLANKALEKRRPTVKVNVIIITDGFSFDDIISPAERLRKLHRVTVFAAGVATPANIVELRDIAGDDSRVFLYNESLSNLVEALRC